MQSDRVKFLPTKLVKADDPSHFMQPVVILAYPREDLICVVRAMRYYIHMTEDQREPTRPIVV